MTELSWRTEKRRVKDLLPQAHNPRTMSKAQARHLMDSLEKFSYVELVAINTDNRIIAGHMRISAMERLGWGAKEIEVRVPSRTLSEAECREYLIRSNKNTGDWDKEILAEQFDPVELAEWGFEPDEMCDILGIDEDKDQEEEKEEHTCPECGQKVREKKSG